MRVAAYGLVDFDAMASSGGECMHLKLWNHSENLSTSSMSSFVTQNPRCFFYFYKFFLKKRCGRGVIVHFWMLRHLLQLLEEHDIMIFLKPTALSCDIGRFRKCNYLFLDASASATIIINYYYLRNRVTIDKFCLPFKQLSNHYYQRSKILFTVPPFSSP